MAALHLLQEVNQTLSGCCCCCCCCCVASVVSDSVDPIESSPPGSPVPGILQARPLEWVAISFSNAWKWKVKVKSLSRVRLLVTPWTAVYQAPPSMGSSRQKYWSGLCFLLQAIFSTQGSNLSLLHWQADSLPPNHHGSPTQHCKASVSLSVMSKSLQPHGQ